MVSQHTQGQLNILASGYAQWQDIQNEEIKKSSGEDAGRKVIKPAVKPKTAAEAEAFYRMSGF